VVGHLEGESGGAFCPGEVEVLEEVEALIASTILVVVHVLSKGARVRNAAPVALCVNNTVSVIRTCNRLITAVIIANEVMVTVDVSHALNVIAPSAEAVLVDAFVGIGFVLAGNCGPAHIALQIVVFVNVY
jgi:hypothetical protein